MTANQDFNFTIL